MKLTLCAIALAIVGCAVDAKPQPKGFSLGQLSVTWGKLGVPTNQKLFDALPLTKEEAEEAGFKAINTECSGANFVGYRYYLNNDPSVILIYNQVGLVSGFQTAYKISDMDKFPDAKSTYAKKIYVEETIDGVKVKTVTAYFRDPAKMCSNVPSSALELNFQNGTAPTDVKKVAPAEEDIEKVWTEGRCLSSMGMHYWYNAPADMDCDELSPPFVLYDRGVISGFGFATYGNFTSLRYEHIPVQFLGAVFKEVPKCLPEKFGKNQGGSTVHVFFNQQPYKLICP